MVVHALEPLINYNSIFVNQTWLALLCSCIVDLLTVEPHTPTPEPVQYDKADGQWYTHDGVDVKDTQQRKGNGVQCTCMLQ